MKVEYVEPFVRAAFSVIESLTGTCLTRGQLSLRKNSFTSQQVTIMAGVTGQIEGTALYGVSIVTAQKIAGVMMCQEVTEMDEMALSAISELGNMITGNATTLLSQNGYDVDITPPSIIRGANVEISTKTPALVVPVSTDYGRIEINVSLAECMLQKAA